MSHGKLQEKNGKVKLSSYATKNQKENTQKPSKKSNNDQNA